MISGRLSDYVDSLGNYLISTPDQLATAFTGVNTDSRLPAPQSIFFCIVGERHDGHQFAAEAVARGAAVVVVNRDQWESLRSLPVPMIGVDNTLLALQRLAQKYLREIGGLKIAVTGTNGKTTCKDMIAHVAAARFRTCATRGNFNNQFGVPISILEFDKDCEVAVFEFAMSTPGEIAQLAELYDPDIRVILNVGPAHLETLKTVEAVAEAKFELLAHAAEGDWAVLNMDDPNIRARSYRYALRKLTYGLSPEFDVHPDAVFLNGSGRAHISYQGEELVSPILGSHHVSNCLATIAVARLLEIQFPLVKERIEGFIPRGYRMAVEEIGGVTVINDAYNANPISTKAALETIAHIQTAGRRVAVLGDMLELGEKAGEYHEEIARKIPTLDLDRVIFVGEFASLMHSTALAGGLAKEIAVVAKSLDEVVEDLTKYLRRGDILLLKASRAIQLEKVYFGLKGTLGRRN